MNLTLPPFEQAQVLIIGDVMLDRYWSGLTSRISPEAPVPIVHVKHREERPGGAGNVAWNITALGSQATLVGVTGQDEAANNLLTLLENAKVRCDFIQLAQVHTITKLRVLSRHQQLIRLDFEDEINLNPQILYAHLRPHLDQATVVVLSDYGKGTLTEVSIIIQAARAVNKPVLVDPKGQDFSKYRGATLITPNLAEFEAVVGQCTTEAILVERGETLRHSLELDALLITRSQDGMTLLRSGQPALHLPAQAREVFDVTGAGDTVIAVLAAALATGQELSQATALANLAAGLVVAKLGAATVTAKELELELALPKLNEGGIYDAKTLPDLVRAAQAAGEKIVMTNGCFDLLHAGHIHYLTQARQLGDRLIVAVNDDDSVRRLKGSNRPLNPLAQRLAVLSALSCVDWVISFAEDTPARLISQILPDILVKGGDYLVSQIAGSQSVLANGGQVLVLDFVEGYSTTQMLAKLQKDLTTC